ncbi:MAG: OmpA family protein, partial [Bacteroidia bacterium]
TQQSVMRSYSAKDGNFLLTLNANHNYALNVSKEGYLFYSNNYSLKGISTDYNNPFIINVPLQPIDTGYVIELKNVFFDIDKFDLKPESKAELNKLAEFLKKNPTIKGELGGHTDNTGDKKKNQLLSQNRAKSVLDYLVTAGIDKTRLSFKGYGDTKPKFPNDTPEHKAANRRTEFKVFKK